MKLSVVISAFNEEKKLPACLQSVAFADEIIVVDNESSDQTAEIAKKYRAKVLKRPNNLMLNINKNYGFSKATGDFILSLDADERVSEELKHEIKSVLENTDTATGYNIPRKNIIFGKWMKHTGWYPDYNLRFFKRGKGRFLEKHVHEKILIDGEEGTLTHPIIHENYDTIVQFLQKTFFIYAPNEAAQLGEKGYHFSYKDAVWFPVREFLGRFFAQKGYKDGFHGLMLSLLMAFYHLVVFAYIWEKKNFIDEIEDTKKLFEEESGNAGREIKHWIFTMRLEKANPVKKMLLKLQRSL